ncbi:inactive pancreatic lipase-related protein 1-like [Hyperolius riggenbachi]|uniref:inactive pancreatic lipase-related protein 1-like n=1 Tax=Hyperolius riggenbachi TaxID=752182 RepID=UPI0035A39CCC
MFAAILLFLYICPTLQGILDSEDPTCTSSLECTNQKLPALLTAARVLLPPPKSDQELGTTMILWTGANSSIPQVIDITNPSAVNGTDFDPKKNTTIISHGYLGDGYLEWIQEMCRALQTKESINCFAINWGKGAGINYLQSVSNIPAVGTQVANFIKFLIAEFGISFSNFIMIGHSLGAHLVGHVGMKCNSLLRMICGMDPASYLFIGAADKDKLDRSDAKVVVIIHTDIATIINNLALHGFGTTDLNAHIDIIVNGGRDQPGCPKSPLVLLTNLKDFADTTGCSHQRVRYYLIASILYLNISAFTAYPASSVKDFNNGTGFPCNNNCIQVGDFNGLQEMVAKKPEHQLYFLNTGKDYPYYTYRCKTTLQISANSSTTASLSMTLQKDSNQSEAYDLYSGDIPINSTSKYLDLSFDGPLKGATISYTSNTKIPVLITLTVVYGHNGAVYTLRNKEPSQDATIKLDPK